MLGACANDCVKYTKAQRAAQAAEAERAAADAARAGEYRHAKPQAP